MSDTEPSIDRKVESSEPHVEEEGEQVKKSAKGKMTPTKLANLAKARAALEAKRKKYPKEKRSIIDRKLAEEEELEKRIAAEAEKKAKDILDKKRLEQDLAELQELREWRKKHQKEEEEREVIPPSKRTVKKKPQATKQQKSSSAPKKRKVATQEETDSESDGYGASRTPHGRGTKKTTASWNSTSNVGHDWLDDVLG